ncbi:unnamed protein product, partial [Dibothriocephalus latus]
RNGCAGPTEGPANLPGRRWTDKSHRPDVPVVMAQIASSVFSTSARLESDIVKIDESRILLCEATATIMKCCFDILGIRTVEKM